MIGPPPEGLDTSGWAAWAALSGPPIAHRGLWSTVVPENSLAAFEAACGAGYGIELDVRTSSDGTAVVFHDDDLERMTGEAGAVSSREMCELTRLRLAGTDQRIPSLDDALAAVGGRTLVLIELKIKPGEEGLLEVAVARSLDRYEGPVGVIGFNPAVTAWFAAHRPETLRGLNADAGEAALAAAPAHVTLPSLVRAADPDVAELRAQGRPVVAWTARTSEQAAALHRYADNLIFEGFRP